MSTLEQQLQTARIVASSHRLLRRLERQFIGSRGSMQDGLRQHLATPGSQSRLWLAAATGAKLGCDPDAVSAWGAACELVHNASLVQDDFQDHSDTRRGRPALWREHGPAAAVCGGDYLLTLAFLAVQEIADPDLRGRLTRLLGRKTLELVRGQMAETDLSRAVQVSSELYVEMAKAKAGALFALPLMGAMEIDGRPPVEVESAGAAVPLFGAAYQCFDDLRDLFEVAPEDSDLARGEATAPVIFALESLEPFESAELQEFLQSGSKSSAGIQHWTRVIADSGAVERSVKLNEELRSRAASLSEGLPDEVQQLIRGLFVPLEHDSRRLARQVRHNEAAGRLASEIA